VACSDVVKIIVVEENVVAEYLDVVVHPELEGAIEQRGED